jgi:hypothetical protein
MSGPRIDPGRPPDFSAGDRAYWVERTAAEVHVVTSAWPAAGGHGFRLQLEPGWPEIPVGALRQIVYMLKAAHRGGIVRGKNLRSSEIRNLLDAASSDDIDHLDRDHSGRISELENPT